MSERKFDTRILALSAFIVIAIGGSIVALTYLAVSSKTIYIEKSLIQAPVVKLTAAAPGILKQVYVSPGDIVPPNTVVAAVGTELIKTTQGGLIVSADNNVGKLLTSQDSIVDMVDPSQLRVVGQVDEDKGLKDIHVGQKAVFTVDAFGDRQFTGIVDEVSPTSHAGDIVFNISDKRQIQTFDVKVRFDQNDNPGFKNGMSAKIWIYR